MKNRGLAIVFVFVALTIAAIVLTLLSAKLALAFVAGITVLLLVFFKPFAGLLLYIILTYLRPQDLVTGLAKLRIMLVVAALILIFFLLHRVLRREKISFLATKQHVLMFALLAIVPMSNLTNGQLSAAWNGFNEFLKLFLPFIVITSLADDFDRVRKACWATVVCMVLLAMNGLLQHFRGYDIVGNTPIEGRICWVTVFGDPNDFSLALNTAFPFILVNLFERNVNAAKRAVLATAGVLLAAAIFFTNSRGGFMALLAILFLFAVRRWGIVKGLVIGAVAIAGATALQPSRMSDLSPYEASASGRIDAWIAGLVMFKSHPIFGVGFQNFELWNRGRAAHSAFVECFGELGAAGYFVWLGVIYTSMTSLVAAEKVGNPTEKKYMLMLQLSLVGFLGSAFFLSQAFSPVLYMLVALATACAHNTNLLPNTPRTLTGRDIVIIAILVAGSMVAFKVMAVLYY